MRDKITNKNGITLIALIITIIILLLLAGIAIAALSGENGIFKKVKQSKKAQLEAEMKEQLIMGLQELQIEKKANATVDDITQDWANSTISKEYNPIIEEDESLNGKLIIMTKDNITRKFLIDKNFNVNTIENNTSSPEFEHTEFYYVGDYQEYEVQNTGYYYIECLGAKGGDSLANGVLGAQGGKGGYTSGIVKLNKGEKIYVYVGGHGENAVIGKDSLGGYNGGGLGTWDNEDDEAAGAGGGATDIRLVSGKWNDFESLKSRIMVAAGGGGACYDKDGGAAGGLEGLANRTDILGGTQTSGYKFGVGQDGFGIGGDSTFTIGTAGAGGGYYGGNAKNSTRDYYTGTGGSSFISGFEGCNAISDSSTEDNIIHTNQNIHYSGHEFTNIKMLDGNNSKVPYKNSDYNGNGFSSITYLGKEQLSKTEFYYVGDYQEYEAQNTGYYYIECLGAKGGDSLANGVLGAQGGKGGYTSGIVKLNKGEKIYVYVGGHGENAVIGKDSLGGYNGGGLGTWDNEDDEAAGAGGGATDIRLTLGEWNSFESLKTRIMVAAGGGGACYTKEGGAAGGLKGIANRTEIIGGSQTVGYKFGIGQDGYGIGGSYRIGTVGTAGAGSGYYGGTTKNSESLYCTGAGGSSFISGYEGCNAIAKESKEENIVHTNQSVHYTGKKFTNSVLLDGDSNEIPYNNSDYEGNGHAIVVYLNENYDISLLLMKTIK